VHDHEQLRLQALERISGTAHQLTEDRTGHSAAEIVSTFDSIRNDNVRKGISRVIQPTEGRVDHVIHHQDIRRPLGLDLLRPRVAA